eukprot:818542-Pyramimonas_sp.AAC.1
MQEDGYTFQYVALAVHGRAAVQPGTVEVLGIHADAIACLGDATLLRHCREFKAWPDTTGGRSACPIPVFYRPCQGHSTL